MSKIDLHIHTTASDGTFSPKEVVMNSRAKDLKAIAITDHDTVDGIEEALQAGKQQGIEVIPGVELSVNYPKGEMHILGYFIEHKSKCLQYELKLLQKHREERNPQVIAKLNQLGIEVTMQEAIEISGGKLVGRPHIAALLKEKGYVSCIQEAFDQYLAKGKPAYVAKEKLTPQEGIQIIKQAGGIAILAHPKHLGHSDIELEELLRELKNFGLDGLEVYYTTQREKDTNKYLSLCAKFSLLATGGTDFHGDNKPEIELGVGRGNLIIPYYLVERMKERVESL